MYHARASWYRYLLIVGINAVLKMQSLCPDTDTYVRKALFTAISPINWRRLAMGNSSTVGSFPSMLFAMASAVLCFLCAIDMRVNGKVAHTRKFFADSVSDKSPASRLEAVLGIEIKKGSSICAPCNREVTHVLQWQRDTDKCTKAIEKWRGIFSGPKEVGGPKTPQKQTSAPLEERGGETKRNLPFTPTRHSPARKVTRLSVEARENIAPPPSDTTSLQILLKYPSDKHARVIELKGDAKALVQQVTEKSWNAAANSALRMKNMGAALQKKVAKKINTEVRDLAGSSILGKTSPDDLVNFNMDAFAEELETRTPWLNACFQGACGKESRPAQIAKCTAASICVKVEHPTLSAWQYRNSFVLLQGGAKKKAFKRLNKQNICMSHSRSIAKQVEFGKNRDRDMMEWKATIEAQFGAISSLEELYSIIEEEEASGEKATLDQSGNSTISSADLQACNFSFPSFVQDSPEDDMSELGVEPLGQQLEEDNTNITKDIPDVQTTLTTKLQNIPGYKVEEYKRAIFAITQSVSSLHKTAKDIIASAITLLKVMPIRTYQVIFDNVDIFVTAKHQSKRNKNRSLHWIQQYAVIDRVLNDLDSSTPQKSLRDLTVADYLPTEAIQAQLRRDYIIIVSRIMVDCLAAFEQLKKAAVRHIPHPYSEEMSKASEQTWLGLQFKNENVSADMVEILRYIQTHFVPAEEDPEGRIQRLLLTILLGGDWLSVERAENVQLAFMDGDNAEERLDGLLPKFELWHAIRNLVEILHSIFYKEASAGDKGSLCSNMNVVGATTAKKGPHDAYNHYKEYINKDIDALIIYACLKAFKLESIDARPADFPPAYILNANLHVQKDWLESRAAEIVDDLLAGNTESLHDIREGMAPKPRPQLPCRHPGCPKVYVRPGARVTHEKGHHDLVVEEESEESSLPKEDHIYNYQTSKLTLALLIRNMDDATKEGDGERLSRCFRMALLYYKAYGHTKYAYGTLMFFAKVNALLPPKLAHSLVWNRVVNNRGGKGNNIPLDQNLEHMNNYLKSFLKHLGPNLNEQSAARIANAIGEMAALLKRADSDLGVRSDSGRHTKADRIPELHTLVDQYAQVEALSYVPGREYNSFPGFKRDLLAKLSSVNLAKWVNRLVSKWSATYENA
ncbi:uncharacterized protein LOC118424384 [Branchiostoma floridae]|uniref:Uncharacterized protein LOC118424384 n=2 Tax=Branchiostoma floridae TaxID=7739 RepID=A0A9J7LX23_BRAFL|nr:uncharacterized protein LOC118424384 [Branchiostoma floridae]